MLNKNLISAITFFLLVANSYSQFYKELGNNNGSPASVNFLSLKVDNNKTPYIAFSDGARNSRITVRKFNGTNWVDVGNPGFTGINSGNQSLAIDKNGVPYVAFSDENFVGKTSVMKFDGTNWVYVGNAGFTANEYSYNSLAITTNGTIYLAGIDLATNRAKVFTLNGSNWVETTISDGNANYTSIALDASGTPFVAYEDKANSSKLTVKKFNGTNWVAVGGLGVSNGAVAHVDMEFSKTNEPHVVFQDIANSNGSSVMKYTGNSWQLVGSADFSNRNFSYSGAHQQSITFDKNNTCVVASRLIVDDELQVKRFNGKNWVTLGNTGTLSLNASGNTDIVFNGDESILVGFNEFYSNDGYVYELDYFIPTISNLSPANNSTGVSTNSTIEITFSEKIFKNSNLNFNSNHLEVYDTDSGSLVLDVLVSTSNVSINNNKATFQIPSNILQYNTHYFATLDAFTFIDSFGNGIDSANFTFRTGLDPNGIGVGLEVWLSADEEVTTNEVNLVTNWNDHSYNDKNAISQINNAPLLVEEGINFNPTLRFDTNTNVKFLDIDLSEIKNSDYDIIAVVKRDNANSNNYFLGTHAVSVNQGLHFGYRNNNILTLAQYANDIDLSVSAFDDPKKMPVLLRGQLDQTSGKLVSELKNGKLTTTTGTNIAPLTGNVTGTIGKFWDNGFNGDISEIMVYSKTLPEIDVQRVYSYLAIKYGLTLDNSGGGTNGDYIASDKTTILWDASENADYHNNIVALAKDKLTNLNQLKSKNTDAGGIVIVEKAGDFTADKQAIFIGSNNENLSYSNYSNTGIYKDDIVLNRNWKLRTNINDADNEKINFSLTISNTGNINDYSLLVETERSYAPTSIAGDTISFSDIMVKNGKTYKLLRNYPEAPTAIRNIQIFSGNATTIADLEINGTNIKWYDAPENGNLLSSATVVTDQATYYASQTFSGFESKTRTPLKVLKISEAIQYIAPTANINSLITTNSAGSSVKWYKDSIDNNALTINSILENGATYYVEQTQTTPLEVSNRVAVTVEFTSFQPVGLETQIFVGDNKTLADLEITGTNIKWYATGSGGNELPLSTILTDETTYFASQSVGSLRESAKRFGITAKKIANETISILPQSNIGNLTTTPSNGYNVKWFTSPSGGTALPDTNSVTNNTTYYAQQEKEDALTTLLNSTPNIPYDVVISATNKVFFVSNNTNAVFRTDINGTNLTKIKDGFNAPRGIAIDNSGRIYIANTGNNTIERINADGTNQVTLGTGFNAPQGITVDASGNIYVADSGNNAIKKMDSNGNNITNLGSGFNLPTDVSLDASGNIFVSDQGNSQVKKMDANGGNISILSGNYNTPYRIKADNLDNIYVADLNFNYIYKINLTTRISETYRNLFSPRGLALDADNTIYVAVETEKAIKRIGYQVSNRVPILVKIGSQVPTAITTQIFSGDDKTLADITIQGTNIKWYNSLTEITALPLSTALVDNTTYFATQTISGLGESYSRLPVTVKKVSDNPIKILTGSKIADLNLSLSANATVEVFDNSTDTTPLATTTTLTNKTYYVKQKIASAINQISGGLGYAGDVFIDNFGSIFYTDIGKSQVVKINASDNNAVVLGSGFANPIGVHVDSFGNIYVADTNNNAIKKMNAAGTVVTVLATGINKPHGIFVDSSGKIYFSERESNTIKKMDADGSNIVSLGSGFARPAGVFVDTSGNIFVADRDNNVIKKMDANGSNIVSLGNGFNEPTGVFVDYLGKIYITDNANNVIKKMNADGTNIETLIGTYNKPENLHVDNFGNVFFGNGANKTIQKIAAPIASNKIAINVLLASLPPTGASLQVFAGNDKTLTNLEVNGTDIKWYDAAENGNPLASSSLLEDGKIYYASQTSAGLEESINRLPITVKKIVDNEVVKTTGSIIGNLPIFASDNNTAYVYENTNSTAPLSNETLLTSRTYYAGQISNFSLSTFNSNIWGLSGVNLDADGNEYYLYQKIFLKLNKDRNVVFSNNNFTNPTSFTFDNSGRIIIADFGNNSIKRINADGSGLTTVISGLNKPFGVAVDSEGKIYFSERGTNSIKKMNADGTNVITLSTNVNAPSGIFIDSNDAVFVADRNNNTIKKMDKYGNNLVSLGNGFNLPQGVTVDQFGKIYVSDTGNNVVKKMNADGTNIQVVVGGLRTPLNLNLDINGNIYIMDFGNRRVLKIAATVISNRVPFSVALASVNPIAKNTQIFTRNTKTLADLEITGTNIKWYNKPFKGNQLPNTTQLLDNTTYFASQTATTLRESLGRTPITVHKVADSLQTISSGITVANLSTTPISNGTVKWFATKESENELARTAPLNEETNYFAEQQVTKNVSTLSSGYRGVFDFVIDSLKTIYIADLDGGIKRKDKDGNTLSTIASGYTDIRTLKLHNNQLYFLQRRDGALRRINTDGTNLTTLSNGFSGPYDITISKNDFIYITEPGTGCIKRTNLDGTNIVTIACGFINPRGIDLDENGNLYVVNDIVDIQKLSVSGFNKQTLFKDTSGSFEDVAVDINNNLFISDRSNNVIKKIDKNGANLTTFATGFNYPFKISVDKNQNIFVADFNNSIPKKIQRESVSNRIPIKVAFQNNFTANSGNWSTDTNWSLGRKPITTDDVVVLSGNTSTQDIGELEVDNFTNLGATNISKSQHLIVNKDFTNSGDFTVYSDLSDSGVLLVKGNASGSINYLRGGLLANKWSLIAAPLKDQKIVEFAQKPVNEIRVNTTPNPDRYAIGYYNDTNIVGSKWQYFNANTNINLMFDVATGYTISRATDGGVMFNGTIEVNNINKTVTTNQWNAIGNSFISYYPINKNGSISFLDDNLGKLEIPAVYIWDNNQAKYTAITNLVTSAEQFLPPGQGFFVKPNTNSTLLFDKNKRSLKPTTAISTFSKSSNTTPYLNVYLESNSKKVNTSIIYSKTATKGFDKQEDIENFNGANLDINTHLLENSDGKNYTIQSLPVSEIEDLVIPISLKGQKNDEVLFSLKTFNFPANINVYLEDKLSNKFIKLDDQNAKYKVTLNEDTSGVGRFYLKTTAKTLSADSNILNGVEIYNYNNTSIRFTGLLNQKGTFKLFDILGKQILKTNFEGKVTNDIQLPSLKTAVYIVELRTAKDKISKKIIIE